MVNRGVPRHSVAMQACFVHIGAHGQLSPAPAPVIGFRRSRDIDDERRDMPFVAVTDNAMAFIRPRRREMPRAMISPASSRLRYKSSSVSWSRFETNANAYFAENDLSSTHATIIDLRHGD